jgi:hypothetical protein
MNPFIGDMACTDADRGLGSEPRSRGPDGASTVGPLPLALSYSGGVGDNLVAVDQPLTENSANCRALRPKGSKRFVNSPDRLAVVGDAVVAAGLRTLIERVSAALATLGRTLRDLDFGGRTMKPIATKQAATATTETVRIAMGRPSISQAHTWLPAPRPQPSYSLHHWLSRLNDPHWHTSDMPATASEKMTAANSGKANGMITAVRRLPIRWHLCMVVVDVTPQVSGSRNGRTATTTDREGVAAATATTCRC